MSFLQAKGIDVWFRSGSQVVDALHRVNLTIEEGEFVCLIGPSGCGKTTLLHLVAGFLKPSKGEVLLAGRRIEGPGSDRAVVMQHPTLMPWMTVFQNIEIGPRTRGVGLKERQEIVVHHLKLVGLLDFAERRPYELSGGMQQRVAVARALANDSRVVLMDEPFGALDALTRETMQLELLRIWSLTGKTIIFVTHDVEEAVACGTRVIVLTPRPGKIVMDRQVAFGRSIAGNPGMKSLRAAKSTSEFVEIREELMSAILGIDGQAGVEA